MIKPYKITEKGKETPFLWNGKRMTFRNKGSDKTYFNNYFKRFSLFRFRNKRML